MGGEHIDNSIEPNLKDNTYPCPAGYDYLSKPIGPADDGNTAYGSAKCYPHKYGSDSSPPVPVVPDGACVTAEIIEGHKWKTISRR